MAFTNNFNKSFFCSFVCIATFLGLADASQARAASKGMQYLEIIGITTTVGAVLGVSTLPFYDQPTEHTSNIAYGASAGAAVGVGIALYGLIAGPSNEEFQDASAREKRAIMSQSFEFKRPDRPLTQLSTQRAATVSLISYHW